MFCIFSIRQYTAIDSVTEWWNQELSPCQVRSLLISPLRLHFYGSTSLADGQLATARSILARILTSLIGNNGPL